MIKSFKEFIARIFGNFKALETWDGVAEYYGLFIPPHCPSSQDLEHYNDWLKNELPNAKRVLILGATPQLRNLLRDFKGEIIVADFSRKMYRSTFERVDKTVIAKEEFIRINWLNLDKVIQTNSVDLILGDFVFMQIRPQDREKFVDNVYGILKKQGLFLTRVKIYNPLWKNFDALDIFRSGYHNPLYNEFRTNPLILYRFGDKILDSENFSFKTQDFIPLLQEALKQTPDFYERKRLLFSINYYNSIEMIRSYFPKSFFESWVSEKFKILYAEHSKDYEESEFCPIYVLKK